MSDEMPKAGRLECLDANPTVVIRGYVRTTQSRASLSRSPCSVVVRDSSRGIFVESLPAAFRMLRENYGYLADGMLQIVNAAIFDAGEPLGFWTCAEAFWPASRPGIAPFDWATFAGGASVVLLVAVAATCL